MALFGLFGDQKEAEVADNKPHPMFVALKEGGLAAESVFDTLQGKLGMQFRAGGGKAIETFCEFYDITCGVGNPDSVRRFAARFLPLLPKADRLVVEHRCRLKGGAEVQAGTRLHPRARRLARSCIREGKGEIGRGGP